MAKVQIKSEKLTPFGGIFAIMEQFDALLSQTIDSTLRLQMEACMRDKKLTERLLKAAKLRYKVFIEDLTCYTERNLTESQLAEVADCNFIRRGDNLLITGLTGCGKSYLACALGHQACSVGITTLFLSMNHFADELTRMDLYYKTNLQCVT